MAEFRLTSPAFGHDEDIPLDRARVSLAVVALVIFVICFTPTPIEPTDLLN